MITGEGTKVFDHEGAARYAALRDQLEMAPRSVREPDVSATHFSELELQSLWFSGAFGRAFQTVSGESVEIVQFGSWNHSAGPDFADAAVRLGDTVHRGAIELDPEDRDWERHGHGENPHYEDVRLHVFFNAGPERFFTRTLAHREVAQVHLQLHDYPELELLETTPAEAHLGRCAFVLKDLPEPMVHQILEAAAQYRLERKSKRLGRTREAHGEPQALYQGMAEALGYRHNAFPLRVLSQRAQLKALKKLDTAEEIDALLFGLAGFLEGSSHIESSDPKTTQYQRRLWSHWWRQRENWAAPGRSQPQDSAARRLPWRTAGGRPQNHPQRRLGALTHLVASWSAFSRLALAESIDVKAVARFLTELSHPYWDHHYTLKAPSTKRLALIGTARARDALINQILPLGFQRDPEATWKHAQEIPAGPTNEKTRRAAIRLFGDDPRCPNFLRKAYQHQALLQIYDDFCLVDASDCTDCPFPEQLWELTRF